MSQQKVIVHALVDALRMAFLLSAIIVFSIGNGNGSLGQTTLHGDSLRHATLLSGLVLSGVGFILPLVRPELGYRPPCLAIASGHRHALRALSLLWPAVYIVLVVLGLTGLDGRPPAPGARALLLACGAVSIACVVLVRLSRPAPGRP